MAMGEPIRRGLLRSPASESLHEIPHQLSQVRTQRELKLEFSVFYTIQRVETLVSQFLELKK